MVQRKISKAKYLAAAFITLVIFLLGLFMGFVMENKRVNYVEEMAKEQKIEFSSLQLQYSYLEQMADLGNCDAVTETFEKAIENLESTRIRLETFEQTSKINKEEFDLLKRDYMLAQLRYWLLSRQAVKICNVPIANVLYFYSTKEDCPDCEQQAFILTYLKKLFDEQLMIFSLDGKYDEEAMVPILRKSYGVETFPTLVIEDKTFSGFTTKTAIMEEICLYYPEDDIRCDNYRLEEPSQNITINQMTNGTIEDLINTTNIIEENITISS